MFDVAGITEPERKRSVKRRSSIRSRLRNEGNIVLGGSGGMGPDFTALADLKIADQGVFASVLPLTAAHADSWSGFREHLVKEYADITVITFAADEQMSMSSDTNLREMLLICNRPTVTNCTTLEQDEIVIVNLHRNFDTITDSQLIASAIQNVEHSHEKSGSLRIADEEVGSWMRQPLISADFPWYGLGMKNRYLAAATTRLLANEILNQWTQPSVVSGMPIMRLGDNVEIGPSHDEIGSLRDGDGRGAFTFDALALGAVPTYPAVWAANSTTQTRINIVPTHEADVDGSLDEDQQQQLTKVSRAFISRNFRMTSQALAAGFANATAMGGSSWTVMMHPEESVLKAYVLWLNSTMGLVIRVAYAQNTVAGRARLQIGGLKGLPAPNFAEDSEAANHAREIAEVNFERLSNLELQSASYAWQDQNRHEIDWVVLEMLGIDRSEVRETIEMVRTMWCHEPAVHGNNAKIRQALGII